LFWNIPQSIVPVLPLTDRVHPITDEYHLDLNPAYTYLRSHMDPKDVWVTTAYIDRYFQWVGGIQSNMPIYFTYSDKDASQVIYKAIEMYPCGWIALDYPRGYFWSRPLPMKNFVHAGKEVEYLGWFVDVYIMHWCVE
jgi:hypothetical protein